MLTPAQKITVSKSFAALETTAEFIRELATNKREHYDGRSERWRESETGEEYDSELTTLESVADELESVICTWGGLEMGE